MRRQARKVLPGPTGAAAGRGGPWVQPDAAPEEPGPQELQERARWQPREEAGPGRRENPGLADAT